MSHVISLSSHNHRMFWHDIPLFFLHYLICKMRKPIAMANCFYFLCHDIRWYMSCSDSICTSPQVSKDDRSDIESSSDEDNGPPPTPVQKHHNSTTNGTNKVHGTNGYLSAGAPCPDEHWPLQMSTGAKLQTPFIDTTCVRVWTWTTLPVWYWKFLVSVWLFPCFPSILLSFSIFASNCIQWNIKALLSVQPSLSV